MLSFKTPISRLLFKAFYIKFYRNNTLRNDGSLGRLFFYLVDRAFRLSHIGAKLGKRDLLSTFADRIETALCDFMKKK